MAAVTSTCEQHTAGMSCMSRSASVCSSAGKFCVVGTAAAVSIFVALSLRLCVLLRISKPAVLCPKCS